MQAVPEDSDSDDEKVKSGKMPFASNVHTAARNNYFNNKINGPVAKAVHQAEPTWHSIQKNEMSQLEELEELLMDEDLSDSVSNSSDDNY